MAPLGAVVIPFLKADRDGMGRIGRQRFLDAVKAMEMGMEADRAVELFERAIIESGAQFGDSIRYITLLSWMMTPALVENRSDQAKAFLKTIHVSPYSVLGTHMELSGSMARNAAEPDANIAFVDPAGLHFIQTGPSGAGGAAGVIYNFLGIKHSPAFPEEVRSGINAPLMAKFHSYDEKKCIHVVGPDFNQRDYTRSEALFELSVAYLGVLKEFACSGLVCLRLLPISGGIFIGPFASDLSTMTVEAIQQGFSMLSAQEQEQVRKAERLEMCIFMEKELNEFQDAFGRPS